MHESFSKIEEYKSEISGYPISDAGELEAFRIRFLGTKNILKDLFAAIKDVPADQKKEYGLRINEIKQLAEAKFAEYQQQFQSSKKGGTDQIDYSLPVAIANPGARHPITLI